MEFLIGEHVEIWRQWCAQRRHGNSSPFALCISSILTIPQLYHVKVSRRVNPKGIILAKLLNHNKIVLKCQKNVWIHNAYIEIYIYIYIYGERQRERVLVLASYIMFTD